MMMFPSGASPATKCSTNLRIHFRSFSGAHLRFAGYTPTQRFGGRASSATSRLGLEKRSGEEVSFSLHRRCARALRRRRRGRTPEPPKIVNQPNSSQRRRRLRKKWVGPCRRRRPERHMKKPRSRVGRLRRDSGQCVSGVGPRSVEIVDIWSNPGQYWPTLDCLLTSSGQIRGL